MSPLRAVTYAVVLAAVAASPALAAGPQPDPPPTAPKPAPTPAPVHHTTFTTPAVTHVSQPASTPVVHHTAVVVKPKKAAKVVHKVKKAKHKTPVKHKKVAPVTVAAAPVVAAPPPVAVVPTSGRSSLFLWVAGTLAALAIAGGMLALAPRRAFSRAARPSTQSGPAVPDSAPALYVRTYLNWLDRR